MEIQLRCHVMSPAVFASGAMYTENISRNGLLIVWRREAMSLPLPVPGQIVTVEIELPANHGFGQKCMHCQGTVTRVSDPGSESPRVALHVNYMDFRAFHDQLRSMETLHPVATSWMA